MKKLFFVFILACFLNATAEVRASTLEELRYQGRMVRADGTAPDGTEDLGVKIYKGSTCVWGKLLSGVQLYDGVFDLALNIEENISSSYGSCGTGKLKPRAPA